MAQVKEKFEAVRNILMLLWSNIGMDAPANHEEIVQFVFDDVSETADPDNWHSGDVAIAFRRWIEAQKPVPEDFICTDGLDGMYGNTLNTLGELRSAMSELDDDDQITLVTIDLDTGDEQDHYPMHLDVIGGIRLTTGQVINEVQFVQERNSEPDTRDKQQVVNTVIEVIIEDIAKSDTTVLDELLLRMPYDVLKYCLPEDMWADFDTPENFSELEVQEFKNDWGQEDDEINTELELEDDSTDYLVGDYFWLESENKWYPKCSSMYSEREQTIADSLK